MARRPLPRILSNGGAQLARSRELARTAADSATDVLQPLITIARGLRRLASAAGRHWTGTPRDRRGALLFLAASVVMVVALMPYGPLLAGAVLMAAAAWQGRNRTQPAPEGPDDGQRRRLQSLYEALVPYFTVPEDPEPLYAHGGAWPEAFPEHEFDDSGRLARLVIRYPAYFTDGEPGSRARIEHLLTAKAGRSREYHFAWDEEANHLSVTALAPLPTDVAAQPFVTTPGETVLGLTDPTGVRRTLPLTHGEERRDVPPVVWRTGIRSTEPHLLVLGRPGTGTSTLLRSVALQAVRHGDLLIADGGGTGEYACLTGREGVLAVECGLAGALTGLEWAAQETERRLVAVNRARQEGEPPPEDTRRPLWILVDRPGAFAHLAAADGRPDPQTLLELPLRHGRAANVTVVVADQLDGYGALGEAVRQHTRARVVLGPATAEELTTVLGAPPRTTPVDHVPPGRGYARLGTGPVLRLQVPATPDPYDDATSDAHRQAVLDLLPPRTAPAGGEGAPAAPEEPSPGTGMGTEETEGTESGRAGADGAAAVGGAIDPLPAGTEGTGAQATGTEGNGTRAAAPVPVAVRVVLAKSLAGARTAPAEAVSPVDRPPADEEGTEAAGTVPAGPLPVSAVVEHPVPVGAVPSEAAPGAVAAETR
ncbi:hypothetical protein [Streptomyces sp. SHP 1-2]|uniref:hypothetical protein n=1 Tax=Streptomyces sp. SHP 1-2 TaxID=2769489 RepID=UPI0022375599|nr:hypothetical protein [Streptomyces sp. SHP 1-2]